MRNIFVFLAIALAVSRAIAQLQTGLVLTHKIVERADTLVFGPYPLGISDLPKKEQGRVAALGLAVSENPNVVFFIESTYDSVPVSGSRKLSDPRNSLIGEERTKKVVSLMNVPGRIVALKSKKDVVRVTRIYRVTLRDTLEERVSILESRASKLEANVAESNKKLDELGKKIAAPDAQPRSVEQRYVQFRLGLGAMIANGPELYRGGLAELAFPMPNDAELVFGVVALGAYQGQGSITPYGYYAFPVAEDGNLKIALGGRCSFTRNRDLLQPSPYRTFKDAAVEVAPIFTVGPAIVTIPVGAVKEVFIADGRVWTGPVRFTWGVRLALTVLGNK